MQSHFDVRTYYYKTHVVSGSCSGTYFINKMTDDTSRTKETLIICLLEIITDTHSTKCEDAFCKNL